MNAQQYNNSIKKLEELIHREHNINAILIIYNGLLREVEEQKEKLFDSIRSHHEVKGGENLENNNNQENS